MTRKTFSLIALGISFAIGGLRAAELTVERGTLDDARFTIVSPEKWNGRLILLAHGLRPEDSPLVSDFEFQKDSLYASLLKQGWIVASTSFRRNGWITDEAIADIEALRKKVIARHGPATTTLIVGTSMGGAIATMIAEQADPKDYQGTLAIATDWVAGAPELQKLTHHPRIPLLFLSNKDETGQPLAYVEAATGATPPPALLTVNREGHANMTRAEFTRGFETLLEFSETGTIEPGKSLTIADPTPESTAVIDGQSAIVSVTAVDPVYGNLSTDMVEADLERIGLKKGGGFTVSFKDSSATGRWVRAYSNVPRGDWLAHVTAEGRVEFARNLANAAQALGVASGDKITVSSITP